MATTLNGADVAVMAQEAIEANLVEIEQLKAFSTQLSATGVTKNDSIKVPVYGATTAIDYNKSTENYGDSQDQTVDFVPVLLDQHIKSTFEIDDLDLEKVDLNQLMRSSAHAVIKEAVLRVYGEITAANYATTPVLNVTPGAFDSDSVADLDSFAKQNGYRPNSLVVLNNAFANNLKKDPALKDASASGSTQTLRAGAFGQLYGMQILESQILPENGEDLAGFVTDGTALAVASAPVRVQSQGANSTIAETFIEPTTGLAMTFRMFYDDDTGTHKGTYEMLFGFKVTRDITLNRITDATV